MNRYAKETERQRRNRTAVELTHGFARLATEADRQARKAERAGALSKAARAAETRRTLRGRRRYNPEIDPFKRMIRERQGYYLSKRLRAGPMGTAPPEMHEPSSVAPDYLRLLEQLRDRHRQ